MTHAKAMLRERVYPDLKAYFDDPQNPTQAEVADELGIAESTLSMIKSRQREPDLALTVRLVNRCRVPVESLMRKKLRKAG